MKQSGKSLNLHSMSSLPRRLMPKIALAFCIVLCSLSGNAGALTAGDETPSFLMRCMDQSTINLKEQCARGTLVLSFFDHTCLPCKKEIPFLQGLKEKHPALQVILVAGYATKAALAKEFLESIEKASKIRVNLPVALDRHGDIGSAFGVKAYPSTFVIGKGCRIVRRIEGYSPEHEKLLEDLIQGK